MHSNSRQYLISLTIILGSSSLCTLLFSLFNSIGTPFIFTLSPLLSFFFFLKNRAPPNFSPLPHPAPLPIKEPGPKPICPRRPGRCRRGPRLVAKVPHGRWRTLTFLAALRCDRITAQGRQKGQGPPAAVRHLRHQAGAPTAAPGAAGANWFWPRLLNRERGRVGERGEIRGCPIL